MKKLINQSFDYTLVSESEAGKLKYYEGELLKSRRRVASEMIEHGRILHEAQQLLANYSGGTFVGWLTSAGISTSSAYNAIGAYTSFGEFSNLENIELTAMYALAKNATAQKQAKRLASRGVKVSNMIAKELIAAAESVPDEPQEPLPPMDEPQSSNSPPPAASPPPVAEDDPWGDSEAWEDVPETDDEPAQPEPEPEDDTAARLQIQRQKTVKTIEAAMRAFDDLNELKQVSSHGEAIRGCKELLDIARAWR